MFGTFGGALLLIIIVYAVWAYATLGAVTLLKRARGWQRVPAAALVAVVASSAVWVWDI